MSESSLPRSSEEVFPWRALTLIAPAHTLAQVSGYIGLEERGWRRVAGLWEQETESGLFRVGLRDGVLLWSPTWEGDYLPPLDHQLPPRRLELSEICFYLDWSGLELSELEILGASGWSACTPASPELSGYLALRGRLQARALASPDSFQVEFHAHGEVKALERVQALYAAECALGLHRLSRRPR
jgi:hypothetical protein